MKITLFTGKTFNIEEAIDFPIKVIKSVVAKKLTLRIDAKKRLPVLTIPKRCSAQKAIDFAMSHRDWINNNLAKLPVSEFFKDGDEISIMGKCYKISHQEQAKSGAFIADEELIVSGKTEFLHRRVSDFLKSKAKVDFYKLSQEKAALINQELNNVCIKDTKSRWGSCSNRRNINYNWRIIMAPDYVIDYLISHEVAHLKHQNHSADFWNCVQDICPNYKEGEHWLKLRGKSLYQYS